MNKKSPLYVICIGLAAIVSFSSCSSGDRVRLHFEQQGRDVPQFNADSAYRFVDQQLEYGPRNPGSDGHRMTKAYLLQKLRDYAGGQYVYAQDFTHVGYSGDTLGMSNIIAAFNPAEPDRIMLCAHWDTRPKADKDSVRKDQPIPGADDGASGVAVLLELARIFSHHQLPLGVDVVLFDGEDYGRENDLDNYFLGSRYWSHNPPVENYRPRFGILLDMVGGTGARFPKEGNSIDYAPALVNELWSIAGEEGFDKFFPDREGAHISDDHVIINRIRGIPTINVIHHSQGEEGEVIFPPYWHTHQDNIQIISRETLRATGTVLLELIYNRVK